MDEISFSSDRDRCAAWHFDDYRDPERAAVNMRACRNRAVAPVTPEAHLIYALTRIAPPMARWFAARTSAVLAK